MPRKSRMSFSLTRSVIFQSNHLVVSINAGKHRIALLFALPIAITMLLTFWQSCASLAGVRKLVEALFLVPSSSSSLVKTRNVRSDLMFSIVAVDSFVRTTVDRA